MESKTLLKQHFPEFYDWLNYYTTMKRARMTVVDIERYMGYFLEHVLGEGVTNFRELTSDHVVAYSKKLVERNLAKDSIRLYLHPVKLIAEWLQFHGILKDNIYPRFISRLGKQPHIPAILLPREIFRIRTKRSALIRDAFCFETLISTGMRRGEFAQLRACDFNFGDIPYDQETKLPSRFVGGSIRLLGRQSVLKRPKQDRITYFSRIAAKMARLHFAKYRIDPASTTPVWPWVIKTNGFDRLLDGIVDKVKTKPEHTIGRSKSFMDINTDNASELDGEFKKRIELRKLAESKILRENPHLANLSKLPTELPEVRVHMHCTRHSFVVFQYYKNFFGERHAEDRLRKLIGHNCFESTYAYMGSLDIAMDDATWETLWIGKPRDWFGVE